MRSTSGVRSLRLQQGQFGKTVIMLRINVRWDNETQKQLITAGGFFFFPLLLLILPLP